MNVGIVTFHSVYNYGAFLQALALRRFIASLGHRVEIVNYTNPRQAGFQERCLFGRRNPRVLAGNWIRKRKFLKSRAAFLRESAPFQGSADIDRQSYDTLVFGSDEIWNYEAHAHGFDPVYFGIGSRSRLVAYAPSLGALPARAEPPSSVREALRNFSAISVRDDQTSSRVREITASTAAPPIVLDPVFLDAFEEVETSPPKEKPFLAVYGDIPWPEARGQITAWARGRGLKTLSIGYYNKWCDENRLAAGPGEFLGLLRAADYVVTNTFHGTMFSIKFRRPFLTIRPENSRQKYLPCLPRLGLAGRLRSPEEDLAAAFDENIADYQNALSDWIMESKGFLSTHLQKPGF